MVFAGLELRDQYVVAVEHVFGTIVDLRRVDQRGYGSRWPRYPGSYTQPDQATRSLVEPVLASVVILENFLWETEPPCRLSASR